MSAFRALLFRDIKLAFRAGGGATLAAFFFALIATLVPFGVGTEQLLLGRIAGGVLWVSAALAALLEGGYVPAASERVGVVVSGGNTTAVDFGQVTSA